ARLCSVALGPVGLALGQLRVARKLARRALGILDAAARLGHRVARPLWLRRGGPTLRRRRGHPRKRLEPERRHLLGEPAGAEQEARSIVERRGVERLADPLHDRVADRPAFVRQDVASELCESPARAALLVEPFLQIGDTLPRERVLLSLPELLRRAQQRA